MASNNDTKIITGTKLKYLSGKVTEYGCSHFFAVLDITPLQDLIELRKTMKMPIWDYNDKFYLKINDVRFKELPVESCFKQDPYIMD